MYNFCRGRLGGPVVTDLVITSDPGSDSPTEHQVQDVKLSSYQPFFATIVAGKGYLDYIKVGIRGTLEQ